MRKNIELEVNDLFNKEIRKCRTFILGAGFSAGAGVPLTAELLSKAMEKFKNECGGIFQRVDNYAKECFQLGVNDVVDYSAVGFSELCTFLEYIELKEYGGGERWSESGSKEKINLRYFLAKTLIELTPEGKDIPSIYIDFVNELHDRDAILSFNWDPLLERALDFVGKDYTYTSEENKIKIYKLHGSVNWRLGDIPCHAISAEDLDWRSMEYTKGMMDREMYYSLSLLYKSAWLSDRRNSTVEPFLVLPGYGKAFDVRANAVLWYKPEFVFSFTHDIYIIGLSLAPDDFFIRSYFLSTLPYLSKPDNLKARTIHIINPDRNVHKNYSFVTEPQNCVIYCEYFNSNHINLMRDNRERV